MELTKIEQDFINAKKAFVEIFKGYCRDYEIGDVTKKFGDFRVVYKSPSVERLAGLKILALKELENGEYETFKDFNAYKKAMREI